MNTETEQPTAPAQSAAPPPATAETRPALTQSSPKRPTKRRPAPKPAAFVPYDQGYQSGQRVWPD
ncbi:hypothetical protein CCR95_15055 [Thiocystis minor]|uniref:hypothetical protein n=1 Tax=Thiocystis minor TaxID=61597 RepID=UPI00191264FA|nr:hypothetical protein [Thiocystis minor]MBK5965369.1 hypothetical protein [Thiocystis minor]